MKYSIKTPLMAADFPDILDAAFNGKIQTIVGNAVERFTLDEHGNPVENPSLVISPKDYIMLANQAARILGFVNDEGNG